jgi:predicted N-acyltransferase
VDVKVIGRIDEVDAARWNTLAGADNPFVRHEFLAALERHGCVGDRFGWYPQHLLATDGDQIVGAVPLYLKDNSYGEFVFDWSWADAYQRSGLSYYPKGVVSVPYTPATGPRLLVADTPNADHIADTLIEAALRHARQLGLSSLHWLFTSERDTQRLARHDLMLRLGCQFHWSNAGYRDFEDFLAHLTAQKRKKIKRERRRVLEQGIQLEVLHGDAITEEQWLAYHEFYTDTFDKRGGLATLSLEFFREIGRTMAANVVLVLASHAGRPVAAAFNVRGETTLYGRHWGCNADYHSLHFEACYYQGLEYCIANGLQRFEPGAQGEHKVTRGFMPTATWSAHWVAHDAFRAAIGQFVEREQTAVRQYMQTLNAHSPYRRGD